MVDFSGMLFAYFFVFFLIVLAQVVVPHIILPVLKPFGTDDVAIVQLLLLKDFGLVGEQFVKL